MSALRHGLIASLWVATCRAPEEPVVVAAPADAPHPADHEDAKGKGPVERFASATTVHMPSHFADVVEIHGSIVRGALPDAHAAARDLLATRGNATLAEWAPHVFAMHDAADRVARSSTLETAGANAAELVRTCGDCHAAVGARLSTAVSEPPAADADPATLMRRHQWAFARLFEGLVIPSDEAWLRGVDAFVELPACDGEPSVERDTNAIARAREVVRSQEAQARAARSSIERARVYGAMLPTCASCHAAGC